MEHLIEIGLFTGKTLVIVFGIIAVLITIASLALKGKEDGGDIRVKNINKKFNEYANALKGKTLNKKELKKDLKEQEKKDKEDSKKHKDSVYFINFEGDIKASQVDSLREEITAVLKVAPKGAEVVVGVESPGGQVHGYGLAASQLLRIKDAGLKLTICVDKVAASGGYMMACTADKIVAAPFAILGSIGVVAQVPNLHRFLKKHDVDYEEITAGDYKRTISLLGEITEKGREKFKDQMEDVHVLFKEFVGTNRPQVDLTKVATGEYWFGIRAKELNLVDELKTSDQYLLELSETQNVFQITKEPKKSLSEKIAENVSSGMETVFHKAQTLLSNKTF